MLQKIVFDNLEEDIKLRSNIIVPPPFCASYEDQSKSEAIINLGIENLVSIT